MVKIEMPLDVAEYAHAFKKITFTNHVAPCDH